MAAESPRREGHRERAAERESQKREGRREIEGS
jgi:hypothetical protein